MLNPHTVTTGEAAKRLGVAPATIQRWVDAGLLFAERTHGGHRRIPIAELRRLIAANRPASLSGPMADFLEILLTGQPREIRVALVAARQRAESWAVVADQVASAVAELGRQWEAGLCSVFQEHGASEGLRRAAASCAEDIMQPSGARRAALFTVAGERHTLGLSLAELVLAEAGWDAFWLGEGPPPQELDPLIEKLKPAMLVVSASPASPRKDVMSYQDVLTRIAKCRRVRLVLGGGGPWAPTRKAHRAMTFCDFREIVNRLRASRFQGNEAKPLAPARLVIPLALRGHRQGVPHPGGVGPVKPDCPEGYAGRAGRHATDGGSAESDLTLDQPVRGPTLCAPDINI